MFHIRALNGYLNSHNKTNKYTYVKRIYQQMYVRKRFYIVHLLVLLCEFKCLIIVDSGKSYALQCGVTVRCRVLPKLSCALLPYLLSVSSCDKFKLCMWLLSEG
jgi:hypothetical protein